MAAAVHPTRNADALNERIAELEEKLKEKELNSKLEALQSQLNGMSHVEEEKRIINLMQRAIVAYHREATVFSVLSILITSISMVIGFVLAILPQMEGSGTSGMDPMTNTTLAAIQTFIIGFGSTFKITQQAVNADKNERLLGVTLAKVRFKEITAVDAGRTLADEILNPQESLLARAFGCSFFDHEVSRHYHKRELGDINNFIPGAVPQSHSQARASPTAASSKVVPLPADANLQHAAGSSTSDA